jgi:predicted phage baseplate assembly protein
MNGCSGCGGCLDRARPAAEAAPTCADAPAAVCCGTCCAGVQPVTPRAPYNRPGLPALDYRAGTYSGFFESMIARLASRPELAGYTTREPDDPGIALVGGWALASDIVTFYTERSANEGYLGTATQPDSLTLLGRLVNYQPRPAVGASGYLAFTMDPGATGVIPAGSQARSVAGPNELPQTFETSETLQARADWNQLAVRLTRPAKLSYDTVDTYSQLTLVGASLGVQAGTRLVFDFGTVEDAHARGGTAPQVKVRVISTVTPDFAAGRTVVELAPAPNSPTPVQAAVTQLDDLIHTAIGHAPASQGAQGVVAILDGFNSAGGFAAVADLTRQLTETLAIAANRVPAIVTSWLAGDVTNVVDQAGTTLSLMEQDQRLLAPDIDYLQRLARALTCPDDELAAAEPDCNRAAPLMTAAAILSALRRPPSEPPPTAAALPQAASTALDPQSTAVTALLTAADPRLTGVLGQAVGRQTVTAPPGTASVIALKTKASPVTDTPPRSAKEVLLDGSYDSLVTGSWFVSEQDLNEPTPVTMPNRIVSVARYTREVALGSGQNTTTTYVPTTKVTTDGDAYTDSIIRPDKLVVYFGGIPVPLADEPITDDVAGSEILLAQTYDGLYPGQRLVITGERTDIPGTSGIVASELTMVGGVEQRLDQSRPGDATLPVLVLATPLAYTYKRDTVVINGNVAAATQGESRAETIGSGAAGQAGQSFPLKQVSAANPLTVLPSDNALGASDTLTVRVNGVRWHETDDLSQAGPNDRVYRTIAASDGSVSVVFGDGLHGSRLPTGQENVTAAYRVGGGLAGDLAAGRITQLASHPLGVNAVTNPLPTSGGTDGDTPGDMRKHAALRCLALDRLLSVQDYADFTSARAGIGQAAAAALTEGDREVIHLTIAGVDDAPLGESDLLVTDLRNALAELGDPFLPVRVAVRELLLLVLSAGIKVGADYSYDLVEPAVRAAALSAGGFARQALGQPVYLSQIVTAMQAVPGVDYVDVDVFGALPGIADPVQLLTALLGLSGVAQVIDVRPARFEQVLYTVGQDPTGVDDTLTSIALRYGITVAELVALNPQLTSALLTGGAQLVVARDIRPAQLALLRPDVPQTLLLRSIP